MLGDETWILLTGDHAQLHERRRAHELPYAAVTMRHHPSKDTRALVACVRNLQDSHERWTVPTIMCDCRRVGRSAVERVKQAKTSVLSSLVDTCDRPSSLSSGLMTSRIRTSRGLLCSTVRSTRIGNYRSRLGRTRRQDLWRGRAPCRSDPTSHNT